MKRFTGIHRRSLGHSKLYVQFFLERSYFFAKSYFMVQIMYFIGIGVTDRLLCETNPFIWWKKHRDALSAWFLSWCYRETSWKHKKLEDPICRIRVTNIASLQNNPCLKSETGCCKILSRLSKFRRRVKPYTSVPTSGSKSLKTCVPKLFRICILLDSGSLLFQICSEFVFCLILAPWVEQGCQSLDLGLDFISLLLAE